MGSIPPSASHWLKVAMPASTLRRLSSMGIGSCATCCKVWRKTATMCCTSDSSRSLRAPYQGQLWPGPIHASGCVDLGIPGCTSGAAAAGPASAGAGSAALLGAAATGAAVAGASAAVTAAADAAAAGAAAACACVLQALHAAGGARAAGTAGTAAAAKVGAASVAAPSH